MRARIRKSIDSFVVNHYELIFEAERNLSFQSYYDTHVINNSVALQGLSPNQTTQKKALENAKRRYAQGGYKSLREYLHRWRSWAHAGLPSQVHFHSVDDIINSLVDKVAASNMNENSQRSPNEPNISASYWIHNLKKGKLTCIKNFSRHSHVFGWVLLAPPVPFLLCRKKPW